MIKSVGGVAIQPKHRLSCHCGSVVLELNLPDGIVNPRRCDCSMCRRRGTIVASVPLDAIAVLQGQEYLKLYQFNTKVAKHYFCSNCGIYTHHQRRSFPNQYGYNVGCLEDINPYLLENVPIVDGVNHPADRGHTSAAQPGDAMSQQPATYLLASQASELERLQLQSRVWEPAARELLAELPSLAQGNAIDVGCGVMGWLRVLSAAVGPHGHVVGTDVDPRMLDRANDLVKSEALSNVLVVSDDLFHSKLSPGSFDLVHARFQIAPLGRAAEQLAAYRRLLRPGGTLIVEDPDMGSWRVNPDGTAVNELIGLIERGFRAAGGNFNSGRAIPSLMRSTGLAPRVTARVVALEPGHPYLRLPLQFAASLRTRLEALTSPGHLNTLLEQAEAELSREGTWGTSFTLIQSCAIEPKV